MVAICRASSPAMAPDAATAAVVSMLPPIHAPATASERPKTAREPGQQEDRRQRERDDQRCGVGELFALGLHRARGRDRGADTADRHGRGEQRAQFVLDAQSSAQPPGEPEDDGDEQQRLDDRRPRRGDQHLEVDRGPQQHQAGLDEELGAEAAGQRVAQRQLGQHEVAEQSQSDCVHREFNRFGDTSESGAVGPLRHLLFEEAGRGAQRDDDEHPGDGVADPGGPGVRLFLSAGVGRLIGHGITLPGSAPTSTSASRARPTMTASQSSLICRARPVAGVASCGSAMARDRMRRAPRRRRLRSARTEESRLLTAWGSAPCPGAATPAGVRVPGPPVPRAALQERRRPEGTSPGEASASPARPSPGPSPGPSATDT